MDRSGARGRLANGSTNRYEVVLRYDEGVLYLIDPFKYVPTKDDVNKFISDFESTFNYFKDRNVPIRFEHRGSPWEIAVADRLARFGA